MSQKTGAERTRELLARILDAERNWYRITVPDWDRGVRETYIEKKAAELRGEARVLKAIGKELDVEGKRVLDAGCGYGNLARALANRGAHVTAADIDRDFCEIVRHATAAEDVQPVCAGAEALPFPDGTFDFVTTTHMIEHVQSVEQSIAEMLRVLKPGGTLYLACPNYLYFKELHYQKYWIPLMPRILFKMYLRIIFKKRVRALGLKFEDCPQLTRHIDELHYITKPWLMRILAQHGIRPLFMEVEEGKTALWKRPVKGILRGLQMYPWEIHMFARKPE